MKKFKIRAVSITALLLAAALLFTGCPQKVKEELKPVYYTVSLVHEGGSLTANPALQEGKALKDSEITFTASPEDPSTHEVDKWEITGGTKISGGEDGSTNVKVKITANTTVKVSFKLKPVYYAVSLVHEGGNLTANPVLQGGKALKDSEITFTASPANSVSHEVDKWEITGGTKISGGEDGSISVKVKITGDTTVKVSFKLKPVYYAVSLVHEGGNLTAAPAIQDGKALKDSEITFIASPANSVSHEVDKWEITGGTKISGGEDGSISVKVKITGDTTVKVTFKEKPKYTVEILPPSGGSLTPGSTISQPVYKGTVINFTAIPANSVSHEVDKWEITGGQILEGGGEGSASVKVKITGDTTVKVTFKEKPKYTVEILPPSDGSLTAGSTISQPVYKGTVINFTASPANASTHEVDKWEITGGQILEGGGVGSTNVKVKITANTTVKVSFKLKPVYYAVSLVHEGGNLTAAPAIQDGKALKDSEITFTASPADPSTHEVDTWEITGGQILAGGGEGSASVKVKITANTTVKVTFIPINKTYTVGSVEFTMKGIAAVDASLGHNDYDDNKPHTVSLSAYLIGETEVTQELWQAVMGNNPSVFTGNPAEDETQGKRPVENVNWYQAIAFCNKLSIKLGLGACYTVRVGGTPVDFAALSFDQIPTGNNADWNKAELDMNKTGFRLPTEAEWEWAAKGGTDDKWAGTNTEAELKNYAWYSSNSGNKTHEVKKKTPNGYGLYDMSGNVWEWLWDWYDALPASPGADYAGAASGSYRVRRGGSWGNGANYFAVGVRYSNSPGHRSSHLGFRLACRA